MPRDQFEAEKAKYEEEKAKLERELLLRKAAVEKEFAEREQAIRQSEDELYDLREKVSLFPKDLETTVSREVKSAMERVQQESSNYKELLKKEFEG